MAEIDYSLFQNPGYGISVSMTLVGHETLLSSALPFTDPLL